MRRLLVPALVAFLSLPVGGAQAFDQGALINASGPLGLPGLGQIVPSTAGGSSTDSQGTVVSADGRFVLFASDSDALLTPEQAATVARGIFLRDTQEGTTELVSLDVDDQPIDDPNLGSISMSADADRIAFVTHRSLLPADANGEPDLYVRDRSSGTTFLASRRQGVNATGTGVLGDASISGSGNYVVYVSTAADLVAGDTNNSTDAFLGCIAQVCLGDTTLRVSVDSAEGQLDDGSFVSRPSISHDGSKVTFDTNHEDADGDTPPNPDNDSTSDVYVRDITAGTTELISRADGPGGAKASTESFNGHISAEGDLVAFTSSVRDLEAPVESPGDNDVDAFVRHLATDQTSRVTLTDSETLMSGATNVAIPQTVAGKVLVGFGHEGSVYVRNVSDGELEGPLFGTSGQTFFHGLAADTQTTVATGRDPDLSPEDDDDFSNVYARPTFAQGPRLVSRPTGAGALPRGPGRASLDFGRQLSADGRYVAFKSEADALLPGELRSPHQQVLVRDLLTGDVTLVSRAGVAGTPGNDDSDNPQISADGRRVLFVTRATNLVEGLTGQQVLLRDLDAGTTTLVSAGPGGVPADGAGASRATLSSDGQVAAYTSSADNLGLGVLDDVQVIVRDLRTGAQQLGSSTTAGTPGDDFSDLPALDGDGSRVAFTTYADNLDGDPDVDSGTIVVKDLVDDSVRVASLNSAGAKLASGGFQPSLDDSGTRVGFAATSPLDPLDADPGALDVAVRDLTTATTTRLSGRADGGQANAQSSIGTLSRDGRFVVFISSATDLGADAAGSAEGVNTYLADVQTGAILLANRRADGTPVATTGSQPDVSVGGRCVAFESTARNVFADAPGYFDFGNVLVKALTGACPLTADPAVTPTPPGPPPVTPPATVPDRTAPTITRLTVTNKRFRRSSRATAVSAQRRRAAKLGTAFRFRLSEDASVRIVLERRERGRRVGTSCRKATAKLRKRRVCTRYVARGTLTRKLRAGTRSVAFSGRVGRRAVPLGTYRARIVATDAARNRSTERRIAFTVVRR